MAVGIRSFCSDVPAKAGRGYIVHGGSMKLPLGGGVTAWPFREI